MTLEKFYSSFLRITKNHSICIDFEVVLALRECNENFCILYIEMKLLNKQCK